jgi:hypothetical protein
LTRFGIQQLELCEAIAVGSLSFVENVKSGLGSKATHCEVDRKYGAMPCASDTRLTMPISAAKVSR